eukprot:m.63093 g.63093  ORF g.63093 m.63093 type:complete len:407 (+) comp23239_c0_seq1:275-1495(+)
MDASMMSTSSVFMMVVVAMMVSILSVWYRVRRVSENTNRTLGSAVVGTGALNGIVLRDASLGVSGSFAPTSREEWWWLEGNRLDTGTLYGYLGDAGIIALSTAFYRRVYDDVDNEWFRSMFSKRASLQQSIDRQAAFFSQMWGGPHKRYTGSNRSHCLRSVIGDHAGAKMFVMHNKSRSDGDITAKAAARWWIHMNAAVSELSPEWCRTHGDVVGKSIEQTIRWFCDHVLERLVWGGPTPSLFTPPRMMFIVLTRITALFARRDVVAVESDEASKRTLAMTTVKMPFDAVPYKRLPSEGVFTVDTIPRGLLGRHNTKVGVWGEINCVKGQLQLNTLEGTVETVTLAPGTTTVHGENPGIGVVNPQQYHFVKPLTDDTEMFIRFHNKQTSTTTVNDLNTPKPKPGFG